MGKVKKNIPQIIGVIVSLMFMVIFFGLYARANLIKSCYAADSKRVKSNIDQDRAKNIAQKMTVIKVISKKDPQKEICFTLIEWESAFAGVSFSYVPCDKVPIEINTTKVVVE